MQAQPDLTIDGQTFEHIVSRGPVSIYRGTNVYLRIGPEAVLRPEEGFHKRLHGLGFLVPPLIAAGEHRGQSYYIEASAGETFGDLFDSQMQQHSGILNESFDAFLNHVLNYADAQLRCRSTANPIEDFRSTIRLNQVMQVFPDLAGMSARAFARMEARLTVFPAVLTHGDFHAFNVCERGVIDFESVAQGFAGYDVVTAILMPGLFPPAADEFSYSLEQIERSLACIDRIYRAYDLPDPSEYRRDCCLARMMWFVAGRERPPQLRDWLDRRYRDMLAGYLGGDRLTGGSILAPAS